MRSTRVVGLVLVVSIFLLALGTVVINVYTLGDVLADRRWLHRSGLNGARAIVADGNVRTVTLRILEMAGAIAVILAGTLKPPGAALIALAGFVVVCGGICLASILDLRDRHRLIDEAKG